MKIDYLLSSESVRALGSVHCDQSGTGSESDYTVKFGVLIRMFKISTLPGVLAVVSMVTFIKIKIKPGFPRKLIPRN